MLTATDTDTGIHIYFLGTVTYNTFYIQINHILFSVINNISALRPGRAGYTKGSPGGRNIQGGALSHRQYFTAPEGITYRGLIIS